MSSVDLTRTSNAELPKGWSSDWLKWHVDLISERATAEEIAELPYVSNEDISSWTACLLREPKPEEAVDARRFQTDDVLFNKLRPYLAKAFLATFDGVSSGELLCLRTSDHVSSRYLLYYLLSTWLIERINSETFGAKMPRADWNILGHQYFHLPSLERQQEIVTFLNKKTTQIDALIKKKEHLLKLLAEKRQALISQAVTRGINPDAPMKPSGNDWLGEVPSHWEVKRLRFLLESDTRNGLYKPKDEFSEDGVSFIQMGEAFRHSCFTGGTVDRVIASKDELRKWGLRAGDILIARRSIVFEGSGKATIILSIEEPHLFESSMIRLRIREPSVRSRYLINYLGSSPCRAMMLAATKRVTISGIDSQQLKDMVMVSPTSDEAVNIADACDAYNNSYEGSARTIRKSISTLDEYRSSLITAAVTGQLDIEAA